MFWSYPLFCNHGALMLPAFSAWSVMGAMISAGSTRWN